MTRNGRRARRRFEYDVIAHHVKRDKAGFIRRLSARLVPVGECLVYRAAKTPDGYPNITFRYNGKHTAIKAHRVFAILQHCAPLPVGMDVGHEEHCHNRGCVRHIALQHYTVNTAQANRSRGKFPF